MKNLERYAPIAEELDRFYTELDTQANYFKSRLDDMMQRMEGASSFALKTEQIRILSEESTVHVFRHFPFWFQFSAARERYIWGGLASINGGSYLHFRLGKPYNSAFFDATAYDRENAFLHNWDNPVGHDHHCLNYDDILALGLNGLRARAVSGKAACGKEAHPFFDAAIASIDLLSALSVRFAEKAEELLLTETDAAARKNLSRIACCKNGNIGLNQFQQPLLMGHEFFNHTALD